MPVRAVVDRTVKYEPLLTVQQAADFLGVCRKTLLRWAHHHPLNVLLIPDRLGRRTYRYSIHVIEEWQRRVEQRLRALRHEPEPKTELPPRRRGRPIAGTKREPK